MRRLVGKFQSCLLQLVALAPLLALAGCGDAGTAAFSASGTTPPTQAAAPQVSTSATSGAQNGAVLVSLSTATSGATIYYTLDGSTPNSSSRQYSAPFLIASNVPLNAISGGYNFTTSAVTTQTFTPNIASGTLVWSDEFANTTAGNIQPNSSIWTYDAGAGGWGNGELETYCAWNSSTAPCSASSPNVYVGTDGYLHIVAQQPSPGVYTSARLKTQGLFSWQYGRIEFRAMVPEAQGFWPAAWLLGNNYATAGWPTCGEMDVMERVNAAQTPDWNLGSIHGIGFTGTNLGTQYNFPSGQTAATWHTYGMIWSPGSVSYYVDTPSAPYVTYTNTSISGFYGSVWPFTSQDNFILLNLAVGGSYPGNPNSSTPFPSQMLVDYVRIYSY